MVIALQNEPASIVLADMRYTAFCDSVEGRIWEHYGIGIPVKVLIGIVALFATVSPWRAK